MGDSRFLISDIGGTNIRVATFRDDPRTREDVITYKIDPATNTPYEVLEALTDYVGKFKNQYTAACLGVAGRVKGDQVQITNRPDLIRVTEVARVLNLDEKKVLLVNDMPPHLAAVDQLQPAEVIEIKPGGNEKFGTRAVLMPGTGVGVGGSVSSNGRPHVPFPSEGGHVDFAPRDEQQDRLLVHLRPMALTHGLNHVSNEFVFCGEGIRRVYSFLKDPAATHCDDCPKSEEITTAVAAATLPPDDLRRQAIELYLKILGAAAGNLALTYATTGGLYLGGSICLSLRKFLATPTFLEPFVLSGPPSHRPLLDDIPVRLIDYKDSGLLGTAVLAKQLG